MFLELFRELFQAVFLELFRELFQAVFRELFGVVFRELFQASFGRVNDWPRKSLCRSWRGALRGGDVGHVRRPRADGESRAGTLALGSDGRSRGPSHRRWCLVLVRRPSAHFF